MIELGDRILNLLLTPTKLHSNLVGLVERKRYPTQSVAHRY